MPMALQMDRSYSYSVAAAADYCMVHPQRADVQGSRRWRRKRAWKLQLGAETGQHDTKWINVIDTQWFTGCRTISTGWWLHSKPVHNFCTLPDLGHDRSSSARVIPNFLFVTGQNKAMLLCKMLILWWTYKKLLKIAIEIVDFPIKNGDCPLQNVSSPMFTIG